MCTNSSALSVCLYFALSSICIGQDSTADLARYRINAPVATYAELLHLNDSLEMEEASQGNRTVSTVEHGWWSELVSESMRSHADPLPLGLHDLLLRTISHSKQVKVFSELPLIRETAIGQADAAFDWYAFLDTRWDDRSDPVGNSLTVGGTGNRFNDHNWTGNGGIRRKTRAGGQLEVAQRFGWQDNNSTFFVPAPQGTSRLTLGFSQPLLRGRGQVYNESLTVLAQIDKRVADDEFRRQLESHLLEVTRAYWALYLERALLLQQLESFRRAAAIASELERRKDVDASPSQVVTARASVTQRRADLYRARAAVKNAEARIRALVNDPGLATFDVLEIVPTDPPATIDYPVDLYASLATAVQSRAEVDQALKQIKAACVRLNMAKHELLPILNLVTETYVSGLEARGDIPASYVRQFDTGAPSYGIGFQYEVPVGNRAASYRHRRRRHELRQLQNQYETTLATVKLEVEVAVRELETSGKELSAKHLALEARRLQLETLTQRWKRLTGEDVAASLALENLLLAQDRLVESEGEYLQSQLTYSLAITNLHRATGTLLLAENISIGRECECDLPTQYLDMAVQFDSVPNPY